MYHNKTKIHTQDTRDDKSLNHADNLICVTWRATGTQSFADAGTQRVFPSAYRVLCGVAPDVYLLRTCTCSTTRTVHLSTVNVTCAGLRSDQHFLVPSSALTLCHHTCWARTLHPNCWFFYEVILLCSISTVQ